jgi:hypothetical protein
MISTYQIKKASSILALIAIVISVFPVPAFGQEENNGLSLSVTPTLFEMAASPSQVWNSSIKVINNNPAELTIYASVVNFAPQGESGEGKFLPVFEEATEGSTLAEWITISQDPVVIPAEQSTAIPFTVNVPEDAAPGGHFAAILVGTRPVDTDKAIQVRTSQIVTSLFFVRIAGDVTEEGTIREFRAVRTFVDTPKADFEVRFENKGNVHLQPQGQIVITNMWGKERGIIPINHQTHFGNVLPESIRKFQFTWTGEPSLSDIGRYKAELTLAYGEEGRKFVSSADYFYVIPVKGLIIVLGTLLAFVLFASWSIKMYVRKMLYLAGVEPDRLKTQAAAKKSFVREGDVRIVKNVSMKAPVQSGVSDLQNRMKNASAFFDKVKTFIGFVVSYRIFFISLIVLIAALVVGGLFIKEVLTEQKDYEVVIDNADADLTLSSEDILYNKAAQEANNVATSTAVITTDKEQLFELVLVNSSDTPGLAAQLQSSLEARGYTIDSLKSDFEESKDRTVIVYDLALQEEALALSKQIGNALLSAAPEEEEESTVPLITVYIGNDYRAE